MKKTIVFTVFTGFFIGIFFVGSSFAKPKTEWTLKSESIIADNPGLLHFVWEVCLPPYGAFDRIALHRAVHKDRVHSKRDNGKGKTILMVPGTWNAGGWSGITDPAINPIVYLANNGYDVYTMDFRVMNVPGMDYDQFAEYGVDIFPTTDWTYAVFREDIKACVEKIKEVSEVKQIFMSGFSRGATHMFIYASAYPGDLKGLISFDGAIKDYPPSGYPLDEAAYNQCVYLFKAGLLPNPYTGEPFPWFWEIDTDNFVSWKLAGMFPLAKNLVGGPLPAGFEVISDFAADDAHHLWDLYGLGEGAFTNYYGGYIDRDILVKVVNEIHRYYPNIQTLEDMQLGAHDDVPYFDYDDNDVYLPAIGFLSKLTCPQQMCLLPTIPNMTLSSDVTINYLDGYGHMDVLYGTNSLADVKQPLLQWLDNHSN